MENLKIFRKRFIPFEVVDISGDEVLFKSDELLVTKWKAIKPRDDISGGISCTFIQEGYKISKFFDNNGKFLYWYCDIVDVDFDAASNTYLLTDLLVDVQIFENAKVKVLDTDELAEALEQGLINTEQACKALKRLDKLLKMIYEGKFPPGIFKSDIF